ncbi:MAG: DUF1730 domain-containing protein [Ruminococcaceae bacterium]|nr:DUF1730 domain-containing protein [Oscillospiraceae bacterium]
MRKKIIECAKSMGLDCIGFTHAAPYNEQTGEHFQTAVVVLAPYYAGEKENSNLARYAWAEDYHVIVRDLLERLAREIGLERYAVCCDTGPQIDRLLAINAGLVFRGKNGMCIHPQYGSWLVIGYLVCDLDLPHDRPLGEDCIGCGKCVAACPGGAITPNGVDANRCLSAITQKKGELPEDEAVLVGKQGMAFGCDVCQNVCPHNVGVPLTPIGAFRQNLKCRVEMQEIAPLSNRAFSRTYQNRAWAWRGKGVIERNLGYIGAQKGK